MKKFTIIFCLIFFLISITFYSYSQENNITVLNKRIQPKLKGTVYQKANRYPGSEFMFDSWKNGEIELTSGKVVLIPRLNYNAYSDELVYALEDNTPVVISMYQVKSFKIILNSGSREFIAMDSISLDDIDRLQAYLELLFSSEKNKLYAFRVMKIKTALINNNPFSESVYYLTSKYIASIGGKLISNAYLKKSYYPYYDKVTIKKIIRKNHLTLKKESDLIKFISLLNEIDQR